MGQPDEQNEPSSPVCFMNEFADELLPAPGKGAADWPAVRAFRKTKRAEILARRGQLTLEERKRRAESLKEQLRGAVELRRYPALGFYWPIRGELDLRDVARRHVEAGGIAALPVVVAKNAPVEFWQWTHGAPMQRGLWNIPIPAERHVVAPDALLIPLVGYDAAGYRLGYGGGYYDRTLAMRVPNAFRVGVGYDDTELATIYPQSHDVPMQVIVTDRRALRFASANPVRESADES